ncbi:MAG: hypothetical protein NZ572_06100 [Thermoflexus sp.]|nr:hypothetical protein [Thermoflexus sp.]
MTGWWIEIQGALRDAARIFVYESQRSGIGLVADLLRMGMQGWGWLLLLAGMLGAGFLALLLGDSATLRAFLSQPMGAGLMALWLPFLWTLSVATASDLPLIFRLLVALYSLYYFAAPLLSVLPPGALLLPALALLLYERARPASALKRWPGRLLWAAALAQFPPHFPIPLALSIALKMAIGIVLAILPVWPRKGVPRIIRGGGLWLGLTLLYLLAWGRSSEGLIEGIRGALPGLWGWSAPLWLWLGANLVEEGGKLGRFWGQRAAILRTHPRLLSGLPFLSILVALGALPLFWTDLLWALPYPLPLAYLPFRDWMREWPADAYLGARTAVGGLLVLGLAGLWMRRRMDPLSFGVRYLSLTIGTVAFLAMFWQGFFQALDLEIPQQWWPLFLVAVAWLWEPIKGMRELTEEAEDLLEWLCAILLLLLTLMIFQFTENPEGFIREGTVWSLLGATVWGMPTLFFLVLRATLGTEEAPSAIRPFLLGYGLMLPLMSLVPLEARWLPPLAFGIGTALWPADRGASRWARWQHAAWIGLGAAAFRAVPWILPLPILPLAATGLERLFARGAIDFLGREFFLLAGGALLAAVPVAWSDHPRRRWLGWGIGVALWAVGIGAVLG